MSNFIGMIGLELMADAAAEAEKAMRKFPQPNYVVCKVAEEAGEVVKAAVHCAEGRETADNLRKEIVQTMAMLLRLYIEGDEVIGLPSPRTALQEQESK
jgi:phosphoribosyl-ATP pyrophosphohydrolase